MSVTRCLATDLLILLLTMCSPSLFAQGPPNHHDSQLLVQPKSGVATEVLGKIFGEQEALEEDDSTEE